MFNNTTALDIVTSVVRSDYVDPYHGYSNVVTFNTLLSVLKENSFDLLEVVPYEELYASAVASVSQESFIHGLTASWLQWKVYETLTYTPHLMGTDENSLAVLAAVYEMHYKKFRNLKLDTFAISTGEMFRIH